jgi:hypothetical protein
MPRRPAAQASPQRPPIKSLATSPRLVLTSSGEGRTTATALVIAITSSQTYGVISSRADAVLYAVTAVRRGQISSATATRVSAIPATGEHLPRHRNAVDDECRNSECSRQQP